MALHADDIRARVNLIRVIASTGDHGRAHSEEDALLLDTLKEIALAGDTVDPLDGAWKPNPYRLQSLARAALKVCDIEYPRHCG
jgi:hypothetical protein